MASHWFGGYVSRLCSPQGFFLVFRIRRCHSLSAISVFRAFMPATGARPKQPK